MTLAKNLFPHDFRKWHDIRTDQYALKKALEREEKDLYTYQLTAEVLGKIGCNEGLMTKLHQNMQTDKNYHKWMEVIQYDMLYGDSGGYPSYASAAAIILFAIVLTITCINLLVSRKHVHY